ncbi:MAG: aldehyde dehydrogenase family protein [Bdellovibrionales bacterium]|nr:aldehyde dehydrogenase family protein [Bdellovibrionales bacterium]
MQAQLTQTPAPFPRNPEPAESSLPSLRLTTQPPRELGWTAPVRQEKFLLGGELKTWTGKTDPVVSPLQIDGENVVLGTVPSLGREEALAAVAAAHEAYYGASATWPIASQEQRIACTETFLSKMREVRNEVVKRIVWEIGKSIADAEKEFDRTIEYVERTIDELRQLNREQALVQEEGVAAHVTRSPRGVCLCMGPFNYPLNETFATLFPALLMGNTAIIKPPKQGVLLYEPLLKAFQESFPPGVVNTVYGDGKEIITPIMESGKVDSLAFIGSDRVADIVSGQHPEPHRLHKVLGLGAKNPGVICKDADLDKTVSEVVKGALSYNGQRCTALKILFVEREIAPAFIDRLKEEVDGLKRGMPWESGVKITPVAEPNKTEWLNQLIEDALEHGATLENPNRTDESESLFAPQILSGVSPECRLYREEQFGPIIPIVVVDSAEEALRYQATSRVGQQISLFGQDPERLAMMALQLQRFVGRVNINTQCQRGPDTLPFGGKKSAAQGTLSIRDALLEFSVPSVISGKIGDESATLSLKGN